MSDLKATAEAITQLLLRELRCEYGSIDPKCPYWRAYKAGKPLPKLVRAIPRQRPGKGRAWRPVWLCEPCVESCHHKVADDPIGEAWGIAAPDPREWRKGPPSVDDVLAHAAAHPEDSWSPRGAVGGRWLVFGDPLGLDSIVLGVKNDTVMLANGVAFWQPLRKCVWASAAMFRPDDGYTNPLGRLEDKP